MWGDVMEQMKRKMTKQEIKDFVSIRVLYFVVMIFIRNFVFSVIMGIVPFVVHFIPMNNLVYIIVDMIITFVITELIFQRFVYRYAYKNTDNIKKLWWLEVLKISAIPLFLWYCYNLFYFFVLSFKNFPFHTEVEMMYMIFVHGKNLILGDRHNSILMNFSNKGYMDYFYLNIYTITYLTSNMVRLLISELVIYNAVKKREKHRDNLINGGIKDEYNKKA